MSAVKKSLFATQQFEAFSQNKCVNVDWKTSATQLEPYGSREVFFFVCLGVCFLHLITSTLTVMAYQPLRRLYRNQFLMLLWYIQYMTFSFLSKRREVFGTCFIAVQTFRKSSGACARSH